MAKKGMTTKSKVTVKCQCSTCGQIANAQADTPHQFCKGISLAILARMPDKFKDLTNPTKKGAWRIYVSKETLHQEPKKAETAA